jgi:hypothetical protein
MSRVSVRPLREYEENRALTGLPARSKALGSPGIPGSRSGSARSGDSIFTTSAPISASVVALTLPAMAVPNESTLSSPSRGPLGSVQGWLARVAAHRPPSRSSSCSPSNGASRR